MVIDKKQRWWGQEIGGFTAKRNLSTWRKIEFSEFIKSGLHPLPFT